MPKTTTKTKKASAPRPQPELLSLAEGYTAPPPPPGAKIIGVDAHPDSFTVAVLEGSHVYNARKLAVHDRLTLEQLLEWAERECTPEDVFLLEASGNSFEVAHRLRLLGRTAHVLESHYVAKQAKHYDNDRLAAVRIARVYLQGPTPAVWVPDEDTRRRRELLHCYQQAVRDHTAAGNSFKSFLNGLGLRLGKRHPEAATTHAWLQRQRPWEKLDHRLLEEYRTQLQHANARRQRFFGLIAEQVSAEPQMLRVMKLLGLGMINAFALLAIIGDIRRFANAKRLVHYVGLDPVLRASGDGKEVKIGIGLRGRHDLRHLLIQAAHAILRQGKATAIGAWGWKLFVRKGHRNIAVAAVARKLLVQVWHLLMGHPPLALEPEKSYTLKLQKLCTALGAERRQALGLNGRVAEAIQTLRHRAREHQPPPAPALQPTLQPV